MIKVVFINNEGGGLGQEIEVPEGTTVTQFLANRLRQTSGYLIRVNRNAATEGYVLQNGDKISVTPTKIEGARIAA